MGVALLSLDDHVAIGIKHPLSYLSYETLACLSSFQNLKRMSIRP